MAIRKSDCPAFGGVLYSQSPISGQVRLSNGHFGLYSEQLNTRPSGIQMVIFRTLFVSGFRMALAAILLKTIRKPDKKTQNRTKKSGFRMVEKEWRLA